LGPRDSDFLQGRRNTWRNAGGGVDDGQNSLGKVKAIDINIGGKRAGFGVYRAGQKKYRGI
jgi:hypothetical protein